jgi:Protein of unknown function (DUF4232)
MTLSTAAVINTEYVGQYQLPLILTNVGGESCTMQGYPNVVLVGPDHPPDGPAFQLRQQSAVPQPLTLAPGASARTVLTFGSDPDTDGWVPTAIVLTLPQSSDKSQILSAPWLPDAGSVQRQDEATRPATYIGPLTINE